MKMRNNAKFSKSKNPKKTFLRLLKLIFKNYTPHLCIVAIGIIISSLTTVYGNLFIKDLIDVYIIPLTKQDNPNFSSLLSALATLGSIYLIGVVFAYIYNRIMVNVSQGTMLKVRTSLFKNMQSLPIKYFDTHPHGDIMSVYTNDTDTLRQLIGQGFPMILQSAITIVSVLINMIILSVPLTILTLAMTFFMLFVTKNLGGKSAQFFMDQQMSLGKLNGYIEEMIEGQKVIKVFSHEKKAVSDFEKLNNTLRESSDNANKFANVLMPINANLGNISYVLCAVIGAILALNGLTGLSLGALVSFLTFNKNFNSPIVQLSQQLNSIVMAMAGAERVFDLLDQKPESDNGNVTLVNVEVSSDGTLTETSKRTGHWAWKQPDNKYTLLEGHVVFDDVDFGYTDEKTVLHNINLFAKPGQKIAFVGSTGAGKTTITNLINRFYDIQDGKIRYDNININNIKKADLRRSLGIVLQDTHLFTGSIIENIRYGKLDATDEECINAAKLANADSFITRLPKGYDTIITGDGSGLSQGQRQLIAIARAAVADPPVLILDEATSSIDTRTEALVQKGMDALMNGRTVFVIAHRLSTVRNSNAIMVLENGRIIERGDHKDLIEQKGKYYQLYTGAFELE